MPRTKLAAIFSIVLLFGLFGLAENSNAAGVLRVDPTNPRYFTDDSGQAIYMTGSHTWMLVQTYANVGQMDNSYQHMENYLDWMQGFGHNFLRMWINFPYSNGPYPWQRPGPGVSSDPTGGPKFDLSKFDQSYFDLLRERVIEATSRGMYVSVMLFGSGITMQSEEETGHSSGHWPLNAWYPSNNINGTSFTDEGYSFYSPNTADLELQRKLVRKTIDTLNDQDNLIWEIINEPYYLSSAAWQNNMADYIRSYEAGKPKQHAVLMTAFANANGNPLLFSSQADAISPDGIGVYDFPEGGDAGYSDKVVLMDTDHMGPVGLPAISEVTKYRQWVWKAFARGTNPIFMDMYDGTYDIGGTVYSGLRPEFDPIRAAMGYTKSYADRMDLNSAIPSTTLCSTGYCLVNAGNEYLVYQPNSGSFTVNLAANSYDYEWFDPNTGSVVSTGSVTVSAGNRSFTPPFSGDAVLYLTSATAQTPYCGDGSCNGTETCSTCAADCGSCPTGDLPDLIVTSVSWTPAQPNPGDSVTFKAKIKNQGTAATPAGVIHGVLFSVDATDNFWSDSDTSSLAPGASVTLTANGGSSDSATWTAVGGTHQIEANVDDVNRITESDESNNTRSASLTISQGSDVTPPAAPSGLSVL